MPPDDGSKCQKCKRTHRLGFYRGITYRDRCECNKGGRKIADEWKLLGYECYKRGLRERELVGQSTTVVRKKSQSPRPRAPSGPLPDVANARLPAHVPDGGSGAAPSSHQPSLVPPPGWREPPRALLLLKARMTALKHPLVQPCAPCTSTGQ